MVSAYLEAVASTLTKAEQRHCCLITDPNQPDNPIVYVTPEFVAQTGYSVEEAMGQNCRFLQGPDSEPEAVAELREAILEEREVKVTLTNYRKDGTPFQNTVAIRPVYDADGRLKSFVGTQRVSGDF